jgi:cystathionine gamma-synthase
MATVSLTPQAVFSTDTGGVLSSATILRFPPNFVRQLSTKARRNCSNIGVAQIVAAAWSDRPAGRPHSGGGGRRARGVASSHAAAASAAAASPAAEASAIPNANIAQPSAVTLAERNLLGSDASLAVHAGTLFPVRSSRLFNQRLQPRLWLLLIFLFVISALI